MSVSQCLVGFQTSGPSYRTAVLIRPSAAAAPDESLQGCRCKVLGSIHGDVTAQEVRKHPE